MTARSEDKLRLDYEATLRQVRPAHALISPLYPREWGLSRCDGWARPGWATGGRPGASRQAVTARALHLKFDPLPGNFSTVSA